MLASTFPTALINLKQCSLNLITASLLSLLTACGSDSTDTDTNQVIDPLAEPEIIVNDAVSTPNETPTPSETPITEVPYITQYPF